MAITNESDHLDILYRALTPALAKASVGDFSGEIELDPDHDPKVNELLMGVIVLLDVINEQAGELERIKATRKVTLIDEVLTKPAD